ncbi:MAG TPA: transaldolase, partial [bacterium]|nr:transaldolase [bacterium]
MRRSDLPGNLGPLRGAIEAALDRLAQTEAIGRLWRRDGTLWTTDPKTARSIEERLGWLGTPEAAEDFLAPVEAFRREVAAARQIVLLGMGGSSLAPEVMAGALPRNGPPLIVLDSTAPQAVRAVEQIGLEDTVFVVSSKSGTTTETRTLAAYFLHHTAPLPGAAFVAVTDEGTPLARQAATPPFARAFINPRDIGGRYSALSFFGLVPAALCGVDVRRLMERAMPMVRACRGTNVADNPGAWLGAVLGAATAAGRDKLTLVTSPGLAGLGAWIEQLIAESTGKQGRGLLPVDGEPLADSDAYGPDRLFVRIALAAEVDAATEKDLDRLAQAGHPVVRIIVADPDDLGAELFRWEVATALAGSLIDINPFDEPNVQQSKDITDSLLAVYGRDGRLPDEVPALPPDGIALLGDAPGRRIDEALETFLRPAEPPGYVGLLAYLHRTAPFDSALAQMRQVLRDRLRVATTRGFGPRYLHSTGQFFKGGPPTGRFLIFTADSPLDLEIPGEPYTFGTLFRAQAL